MKTFIAVLFISAISSAYACPIEMKLYGDGFSNPKYQKLILKALDEKNYTYNINDIVDSSIDLTAKEDGEDTPIYADGRFNMMFSINAHSYGKGSGSSLSVTNHNGVTISSLFKKGDSKRTIKSLRELLPSCEKMLANEEYWTTDHIR